MKGNLCDWLLLGFVFCLFACLFVLLAMAKTSAIFTDVQRLYQSIGTPCSFGEEFRGSLSTFFN